MYFKLFDRDPEGTLRSLVASRDISPEYEYYKWAKPVIGKLFVFNCFSEAYAMYNRAFALAYVHSPEMWIVDAQESSTVLAHMIIGVRWAIDKDTVRIFWTNDRHSLRTSNIMDGTVLADAVRPRTQIHFGSDK